jgi:hypothetical protein
MTARLKHTCDGDLKHAHIKRLERMRGIPNEGDQKDDVLVTVLIQVLVLPCFASFLSLALQFGR